MSNLNRVELIGNLGQDPEILKQMDTGAFVRLSVGTNKKYKNAKGEIVKDTQWHTVYLGKWLGDKAASQLKKGSKVYISGELRTSKWEDEKTGEHRYSVGIFAKSFEIIAKSPKENDVSTPDEMDAENNSDPNALVKEISELIFKSRRK